MRLIYFLFFMIFLSCKNDPLMVNNLFNYENYPLEVIKNSKLIHTEDGKIKLEVNSSKIERFSGDEPKLIFTDGFKVIFYNTSGKITSNLTANSAIVDEKKNIMTATDSVILKNNERKLETEILIWDENKDKIYTDSDVIITTSNEIIYAQGFISDTYFSDYTLKKISGKMFLNSPNN